MTNETIYYRKANRSDLQKIWYLLHADSKMLKEKQILAQIDNIFILCFQKKILGVLCGTYGTGKVNINWVVIHPLYPKKVLSEAMIQELYVFSRESVYADN